MRLTQLGLFLLSIFVFPLSANAQAPQQLATRYNWHSDLNRAKAEARKTGKPMFLVFRCVP